MTLQVENYPPQWMVDFLSKQKFLGLETPKDTPWQRVPVPATGYFLAVVCFCKKPPFEEHIDISGRTYIIKGKRQMIFTGQCPECKRVYWGLR
jgi:hypothetical protein